MFFEQNFSGGDRVPVGSHRVRLSPVFRGGLLKLRIDRIWRRFFRLALRGAQETQAKKQQGADPRKRA
jgi:hypothetical protein